MDEDYNTLLGRPRMHKNAAITSTYHQCVKYPLRGAQGTITADNDPLFKAKACYADDRFHIMKGHKEKIEGVAEDKDIPITPNSSLAEFIKPVTQLNCGL